MRVLLFCFATLWVIVFLSAPTLSAGWVWDTGNALGFAAMAGLLFLSVPGGARLAPRQHELIAYGLVILVAAHVLWFLLLDGAVVQYLTTDAPAYMWSGIAAAILVIVLVLLALMPTRLSVHKTFGRFRRWHRAIAIVAILASAYHLIGSGLYLQSPMQAALLLLLCVLVIFGRRVLVQTARVKVPVFVAVTAASIVIFVTVRLVD